MRVLMIFATCGLGLAGCGEQANLPYQGRPAATALECQAAYENAKQRTGQSVPGAYSSGAAILGTSIGRGIGKGILESSYNTCLARVAGMAPGTGSGIAAATVDPQTSGAVVPKPVATPQPKAQVTYGGTAPCGLKMVGGSGYACAIE